MPIDKLTAHNRYHLGAHILLLVILCLLFGCNRPKETKQVLSFKNHFEIHSTAVNINTAPARKLRQIPHIGEQLAERIIRHRERFGRFRQPAHLMLVRGISDRRFRQMRRWIRTE